MSKAKKIVIRVLLIIFVIISLCSITLNVIAIVNGLSGRVFPTEIISKNGCDVLRIPSLADQRDSHSLFIVSDDGVIEINSIDKGWELIPKKSGRCVVVSKLLYGGHLYADYNMYDITVDENLKISYTKKNIYKFSPANLFHGSYADSKISSKITLKTNGGSVILSDDTVRELRHEIDSIYGNENVCKFSPDITDCAKIIFEKNYSDDTRFVCEFYVSKDRFYYCNIIAGNEEWHEFVPEDFCSLDRINELLDLKD
ncbi:MAG: hypothetical protein K2H90_01890 [Oscillospiraceae bacterium]|nr:hypothetical protein [Oscillospiraceae bacterium]